jgi:hypothetical protein
MWKEHDMGRAHQEERERRWYPRRKSIEIHYLYVFKDRITVWKGSGEEQDSGEQEYNGKDQLVQSTLYTCMKMPQWNPLVLLMYINLKDNETKNRLQGNYRYVITHYITIDNTI